MAQDKSYPHRLLILGGTQEARLLADQLAAHAQFEVITSLAGRTDNPLLPDGETRIGGFGGAKGLAHFIKTEKISALVDATHPFARTISANAHTAADQASVPIFHLERPPWKPEPGDQWQSVMSLQEGIASLPKQARVLVTIGRQQLDQFLVRDDLIVFARAIEAPALQPPAHWTIILERPPLSLESEIDLLKTHEIEWLMTKNAGGGETRAKLLAARDCGVPVIMVERLPAVSRVCFPDIEQLQVALLKAFK